jgi:hypothetical protein
MGQPGRAASLTAAILIASGSPAHGATFSAIVSGSAAARYEPTILANSSAPSGGAITGRQHALAGQHAPVAGGPLALPVLALPVLPLPVLPLPADDPAVGV